MSQIPQANNHTQEIEKEVLFQKIGGKWYAFTFDGDQMNFTALPSHINPQNLELEIFEEIINSEEKQAA